MQVINHIGITQSEWVQNIWQTVGPSSEDHRC